MDAGFIASVVVALLVDDVDDPLEFDEVGADEFGDVELGVDMPDDAVGLDGVDDDELLVVGGVAGIDGVVLLELLVAGGVLGAVAVSLRCWQPAVAASTAMAAAVIMNRFIMAPLSSGSGDSVASLAGLVPRRAHRCGQHRQVPVVRMRTVEFAL